MQNRVTSLLGSKYPVILGAMRLITLGEFAAKVSNSGGFGVIATSGLNPEQLRDEIKKARELTDKPFGVNIPIYRPKSRELLEVAIDEDIGTVITSAGNPAEFAEIAKSAGLNIIHKVSSLKAARIAESAGVDAVIAMGFEAGGHIGRDEVSTFCLIPRLVDELDIPVIAAGGIADGRTLLAAFALGAEGVEVGTRFLATKESRVPEYCKEAILEAECTSTIVVAKSTLPLRVLNNKAAQEILKMEKEGRSREIGSYGDKIYIWGGDKETALIPCGQVVGIIREIVNVSDIIPKMIEDAKRVHKTLEGIML